MLAGCFRHECFTRSIGKFPAASRADKEGGGVWISEYRGRYVHFVDGLQDSRSKPNRMP